MRAARAAPRVAGQREASPRSVVRSGNHNRTEQVTGRSPDTRDFEELREIAQSVLDSNGALGDLKEKAETLAERYLALHDHFTASRRGGAAILRLRAGDPLPQGAQFSQIVGSIEEPVGSGTTLRRVYLVLVEGLSAPR